MRVPNPKKPMRWAYGVTTVAERRDTLLPRTLASLAAGGFELPWLWVDNASDPSPWHNLNLAGLTLRYPRIRTHGNWVLGLMELFIRNPDCHRYAMFQDDFVTVRNLRQYLEHCEFPDAGYWNLFTFPANQLLAKGRQGWFPANQRGRGAVALVFSREGVCKLLESPHMVERPMNIDRGWRNIDGGIVTAFAKVNWQELCHNPSLVQHTGDVSSMNIPDPEGKPWLQAVHPKSESFPGEDFDALNFLKQPGVLPCVQPAVIEPPASRVLVSETTVVVSEAHASEAHASETGSNTPSPSSESPVTG